MWEIEHFLYLYCDIVKLIEDSPATNPKQTRRIRRLILWILNVVKVLKLKFVKKVQSLSVRSIFQNICSQKWFILNLCGQPNPLNWKSYNVIWSCFFFSFLKKSEKLSVSQWEPFKFFVNWHLAGLASFFTSFVNINDCRQSKILSKQ